MSTQPSRSFWGRPRFKGGFLLALLGGPLVALSIGWASNALRGINDPLLYLIIFASCWPVATILLWAFVVERTTVKGAIDKPERSAESAWLESAQSHAFMDTLALLGIGSAILTIGPFTFPNTGLFVLGIVAFMIIDAGIRYALAARSGQ